MNNKKRISIKLLLLVPVFILGFLAIFSNAQAIINLGNVNNTAVTISDEQMKNITVLSEIQNKTQSIHKTALSHIIATDLDTLIEMVESVRKEQENIEADFEQYGKNLKSIDSDAYDKLLESYEI